jgi:hypothetical protein
VRASDKHRPNTLPSYLETHSTIMGHFVAQGFIVLDELDIRDLGNGLIEIAGDIHCVGGVRVTVNKLLEVKDPGPPTVVQTMSYNYAASVDGRGCIFRHCSPHDSHSNFHHRHDYDVFGEDVDGAVTEVPGDWPTLGEFIGELREWTSVNSERLSWDEVAPRSRNR